MYKYDAIIVTKASCLQQQFRVIYGQRLISSKIAIQFATVNHLITNQTFQFNKLSAAYISNFKIVTCRDL